MSYQSSYTAKKNTPPQGYKENSIPANESQVGSRATGGARAWYNPHNPELTLLRIYENELHFKQNKYPSDESGPPKRRKKDINRFSKKSRLRVLRKFNQVQTKALSAPVFCTFAAKHKITDPDKMKSIFLDSFIPGLKKIIPNLVYAWRMEPHADGIPHFHFFAWSFDKERNLSSQYYKRQIRDLFSEVIGDFSPAARRHGIKVIPIRSHRKAMSYVSKYMSKEDQVREEKLTGRRWGVSTNFPAVPITEIKLSRTMAEKLKKAVKKLLYQKGGRFVRPADNLDTFDDVFIWLSLEEIMALFNEIDFINLPSEVNFYAETGSTDPPDSFFDMYNV